MDEEAERKLALVSRGLVVFLKFAWPGLAAIGAERALLRDDPFLQLPREWTIALWCVLCWVALAFMVLARSGEGWFWARSASMAVNLLAFVSVIVYGASSLAE